MGTEPGDGPAISIVQDSDRYRGIRRRPPDGPRWRRYPAGAVFIGALLAIVTIFVALRTVTGTVDDRADANGWQQPPAPDPPTATGDMSPTAMLPPDGPVPGPSSPARRSPVPGRTTGPAAPPQPSGGASVLGPVTPSATPPVTPSPTPVDAIVGIGGKCVEVAGGATANGTRIQLGTCTGAANQRWTRSSGATITARSLGKCLDVRSSGKENGTPTQLYDCNGTGAQVWQVRADGTWLNPQSGRCLDAEGGQGVDGARLYIWDCHGGANQRWR